MWFLALLRLSATYQIIPAKCSLGLLHLSPYGLETADAGVGPTLMPQDRALATSYSVFVPDEIWQTANRGYPSGFT